MGEAVNEVRKHEHRYLLGQGDKTLTGSKYLWLHNEENIPMKRGLALTSFEL